MNVVQREKSINSKLNANRYRNDLVRKDSSLGIRGSSAFMSIKPNTSNGTRNYSNNPRYQFSTVETQSKNKRNSMGPPLEPPKSSKRRLTTTSTSSARVESSSGPAMPRVLASDSGAADTSQDFCTPRNRPTALRYISSSSRGGHSGNRSARSTSASAVEASVVLAISEGRGLARGEIGIAAVDLRHPHLVLCQFSDTLLYTHTLTKINYFNPIEIIVPHTFCEGVQPNQMYQLIKEQFPSVNLTPVQRRHFNDAAGRQQIQSLCAPQYSAVYLQVLQKFYALTAAAAVLKYVENIQCVVFVRESLKVEYHSSENTMIIDVGTATQLELVQPLVPSAGASCCLLGVLGPTYTVGGIRALRAAILQPSCNKEFIESRLDAVQDIIENDNGLMTSLQDVIKRLSEIDKILLLCMESANQNLNKVGEAQLNQTLLLKTTMEMVPKLVEACAEADSSRLKAMKMDFENPHYIEITDRIRNIIQEDAHLEKGAMGSLQRCFAVKPEINGLLDVARRTYSELIEDIQKIVEQLSETYDLPIRLNQNVLKGFHIVLPIAPRNRRHFKAEDLPDIFIQVQNNGASVTMTTEDLVVLDQQAKESLNEIQKMSNIVISGLLKDLRPFMSSLYKLCENVAELDILLALAHASIVGSYIRPEFSNYLDVRNSVHPLLDYNSQTMPVPNDIYASPEHNFTIITGPNMGGKSIYIKQIALMQIMAQLGCFLPATKATLRLCDRVFSRIGFNDSVELNASTYVFEVYENGRLRGEKEDYLQKEMKSHQKHKMYKNVKSRNEILSLKKGMKEIQHIMQGLTKTSLVIIDELCRGTCTEEGTSIAWAICEELLLSDAFTFFTTHFLYLTRLQDLYFNVVNLQTTVTEENISESQETQISQRRLVYQHKIEPGTTKIERYGLALASKTNLPEVTVKFAEELAELIIQQKKPQEIRVPAKRDEKILYDLNAEIRKETRKLGYTEETIKQMLKTFKDENPELISRLRIEKNSSKTNTSAKSSDEHSKTTKSLNNANFGEDSHVETNIIQRKFPIIAASTSDLENNTSNDDVNYPANRVSREIESNNKKKPKTIVYSTSDFENDTDHMNGNLNFPPATKKPPRIVYSTTDLENDNSTNENADFTSVRSSNELLNTIIRSIENETDREESGYSKTPQNQNNFNNKNADINISFNRSKDSIETTRNGFSFTVSGNKERLNKGILSRDASQRSQRIINNSPSITTTPKLAEMNSMSYLQHSTQNNKSSYNDTEDVEMQDVSCDLLNKDPNITEVEEYDLADALTQVIETEGEETFQSEQSEEISQTDLSDDDIDMSSSIDKELMKETVAAINDELNTDIFSIILTPPMEFRD